MKSEQRKRFFQTLFGSAKGYIEIRTIDRKGRIKQFWYETSEVNRLLLELEKPYFQRVNTYFGVCPRRTEEGKEGNVKQVNCLWVDLDAGNPQEKEAARKRLDDFDPEPSMIVNSGHGYHCYWLFDKPEDINNQEDILRVKGYNRGLAEELKGDKGIDLSRILRVPGTRNLKDPKNILAVTIIKFEPQIRYSLKGQFLARFKRAMSNEIEKVELGHDPAGNIPDRFWRILQENTKIKATWEGKRRDLRDKTRSGYDMALANLLMPLGFTDGELWSILGGSESGKGKEAKPQYLAMTIGKAKAARKRQKKEKEKRLEDDKERLLSLGKEKEKVSPRVVSEDKMEGIDQDKLDKLLKEAIPKKGFLRDYIDMFSEVTDTPEAFLFWGAMVTLSTILGKRVWVPWEARKLYPNIWCVFLAPSGFRKGTGIDIPTLLLRRVDETLLLPQVGSEEGLTKTLDSHEGKDTGFVRWQEFSKILRSWSNKQSWQASQEFWIDLWDSKPLRKKLSGGEFSIPTTSISFLSACTPKSFSTFFSPEDLEGGFFGRVYLITSLEKRKYFPIPPSIDRKGDVNELVKGLHEIKEYFTGELSYTRIEDSFNHWAKKIQANHEEGFLDSFYSRIETHCMKLAMIYEAALTRKREIREESFNYATKALDFLVASAYPLASEEIGISEEEKTTKRIFTFIQAHRKADRRIVMRKFHLQSFNMDRIEKTLIDRGLIEVNYLKGERGPARKFYLVT